MPNLPTVTVTQAQADRILEAFGGTVDIAVPAYKEWLTKSVRDYVLISVANDLTASRLAAEAVAYQTVMANLPPDPGGPPE